MTLHPAAVLTTHGSLISKCTRHKGQSFRSCTVWMRYYIFLFHMPYFTFLNSFVVILFQVLGVDVQICVIHREVASSFFWLCLFFSDGFDTPGLLQGFEIKLIGASGPIGNQQVCHRMDFSRANFTGSRQEQDVSILVSLQKCGWCRTAEQCVGKKRCTHWTFLTARPKFLMRYFTNIDRK